MTTFIEAVDALNKAQQQFNVGELSPLGFSGVREAAIVTSHDRLESATHAIQG